MPDIKLVRACPVCGLRLQRCFHDGESVPSVEMMIPRCLEILGFEIGNAEEELKMFIAERDAVKNLEQ